MLRKKVHVWGYIDGGCGMTEETDEAMRDEGKGWVCSAG